MVHCSRISAPHLRWHMVSLLLGLIAFVLSLLWLGMLLLTGFNVAVVGVGLFGILLVTGDRSVA